jgi:hypothetical protein
MIKYPTFRQTEKTLKDALPCTNCTCDHTAATVNVFLDGDTLRVTHFRLNCGKTALVDLKEEIEETVEEEVEVVTSGEEDGSD